MSPFSKLAKSVNAFAALVAGFSILRDNSDISKAQARNREIDKTLAAFELADSEAPPSHDPQSHDEENPESD